MIDEDLLKTTLKTLMEQCRDGNILTYLHSRTIHVLNKEQFDTGEEFLMCSLHDYDLFDNIIRCGQFKDGRLEEQSRENCLEYQTNLSDPKIPEYIYFAFLEQRERTYAVFHNLEFIAGRVDVLGGSRVFQRINDEWVERTEEAFFWRT